MPCTTALQETMLFATEPSMSEDKLFTVLEPQFPPLTLLAPFQFHLHLLTGSPVSPLPLLSLSFFPQKKTPDSAQWDISIQTAVWPKIQLQSHSFFLCNRLDAAYARITCISSTRLLWLLFIPILSSLKSFLLHSSLHPNWGQFPYVGPGHAAVLFIRMGFYLANAFWGMQPSIWGSSQQNNLPFVMPPSG